VPGKTLRWVSLTFDRRKWGIWGSAGRLLIKKDSGPYFTGLAEYHKYNIKGHRKREIGLQDQKLTKGRRASQSANPNLTGLREAMGGGKKLLRKLRGPKVIGSGSPLRNKWSKGTRWESQKGVHAISKPGKCASSAYFSYSKHNQAWGREQVQRPNPFQPEKTAGISPI